MAWAFTFGCGGDATSGGTAGSAGAAGAGKPGTGGSTPEQHGGDPNLGVAGDVASSGCSQGDTRECLGPGRCQGAQYCDGLLWSACDCGQPQTGGTSQGGQGSGGAGDSPNIGDVGQAGASDGGHGGASQGGAGGTPDCSGSAGQAPGTSCECGSDGQTCCGESFCFGSSTICLQGICRQACGGVYEPCCAGTGRGSGTRCLQNYQCSTSSSGYCAPCGGRNQACCFGPNAVQCRSSDQSCNGTYCEYGFGAGGIGAGGAN